MAAILVTAISGVQFFFKFTESVFMATKPLADLGKQYAVSLLFARTIRKFCGLQI